MTKEEAIAKLKEIQKSNDPAQAHPDADGVLCELLTALGFADVVEEYDKIDKWFE